MVLIYTLTWKANFLQWIFQIVLSGQSNFFRYFSAVATYHQTAKHMSAENEIIERCKEDPRHFAPVYEKYYDQIFIFIQKRVDHTEATADLTSRVFLKCLKNIRKYKFRGVPFSAWLYRIAVNEVNQFFRSQVKMQRTVSLEDHHINVLFDEMEYEEHRIDPGILISALLEQLSEDEVQYLELRFFEGRSFRDIAYFLGITEVNAKVKTYRILKKLKKIALSLNNA
ncbi:MAG: sigma-70 family RNA polymerase sigma factor [Cyclobacteriaceae bacterium]|nr:sigma-70 family RNA polymerase sigma factor [Cyclobacteriaceae bacterium]